MKTIWKFPLKDGDVQRIEMPKGAQILTVQRQYEQPCVWAIVDVDDGSLTEMRVFEVHGTGNPLPDEKGVERAYVGTFQQPPFVWHLFERIEIGDQFRSTNG